MEGHFAYATILGITLGLSYCDNRQAGAGDETSRLLEVLMYLAKYIEQTW